MAYKFQRGDARMSGSLTQEEGITVVAGGATVTAGGVTITAGGLDLNAGGADFNNTGLTNAGAVSGVTTLGTSGAATLDSGGTGSTFGGALTTTGILKTDDTTDASTNADGSLQTDGGLSVAKAIFNSTAATLAAASGVVTMGSTTAATVSAAGVVNVNNATEASTTGDGSLQTDGGLSVVKSVVIGDDLDLLSDGAIMNIGSTSKFTLTDQAANNCVMAASGARLAFGNAGEYISGDGTDLDIISSGDLDITATLVDVTGAGTFSGILKTDDTTEATSTTDGSLQTDGGLSVAKSAVVGDDLDLLSNSAILSFGADKDVTLTHVHDTGLLLNGSSQLQFRDSGIYISSSADGYLDLTADTKINMSGAVAMTSTLAVAGATTLNGAVTLGNATSDDITVDGLFAGGLVPKTDATYSLGSTALGWNDLHLGEGGVINWDNGDATLTQASDVVTLAGATLTATFTNSLSKAANSGLAMTTYNGSAAVSDLAVDLNVLSAAAVDVATDSIAIIDSNDSNGSRKETIADLATAMAGAGITATNGVFSTDASSTPSSTSDGTTLSEGFNYFPADLTGSAGAVVLMPATPSVGDIVYLKAKGGVSATSTITIKRTTASHTIDGNAELIVESPYGAIGMSYVVANDWRVF